MNVDEMVAQSTAIVRGKVAGAQGVVIGKTIHTQYRVQVGETLKGTAGATVDIVVPGGTLGGMRQTIAGAPKLDVGTEYVVFVWTGKSGRSQILGLSQGLFDVKKSASGEIVLQRSATDARVVDGQGREVEDRGTVLKLADLMGRLGGKR
jgi:hypothetical protein